MNGLERYALLRPEPRALACADAQREARAQRYSKRYAPKTISLDRRLIPLFLLVLTASTDQVVRAQSDDAQSDSTRQLTELLQDLSPSALVRKGNHLLLANQPGDAINAYARARKKDPNAPQIDFVTGLAQYALGEYDEARAAFEDAAAAKNPSLVDDALYSIGTTYHAQALANSENPQRAVAQLEQAMQRYQSVLAHRPDHEEARDANYKAATIWRSLKKMLEEQQQHQQQQDQEQEDSEQSEDDQQQPGGHQSEDQQQDEQQGDESQQAQDDQKDQQEGEQKQAEASEKEEETREQAERKLREMMQALRDRKRQKQENVQPVRLVPVEKDW